MLLNKAFIIPKEGSDTEDCQDAISISKNTLRFAIADGATREFFSGIFAKKLVNFFCNNETSLNKNIFETKNFKDWLKPIQEEWLSEIETIIGKDNINLTVKNGYNTKRSAASTFIGLEIDKQNSQFKIMIIGDSCLFHIRGNHVLKSYLIDNASLFDNSPEFFFSRNEILTEDGFVDRDFIEPKVISDNCEDGDYFLLATDAISKWLLKQKELGNWEEIWNNLKHQDEEWYGKFIQDIRKNIDNKLEDDDVSLLIIQFNSLNLFEKNIYYHKNKKTSSCNDKDN